VGTLDRKEGEASQLNNHFGDNREEQCFVHVENILCFINFLQIRQLCFDFSLQEKKQLI
jgi:hypothetical protein